MDKTKIEKIATTAVQNLFVNNAKRIDPNIEDGDKGISFDGDIILFSEGDFTKEGYLSKIPVQVKGTVVDVFSEKSAKYYNFDQATFKNFQLEDGVVVFLVEVLEIKPIETKIFYKFLSTKELEVILTYLRKNNRNKKVIELLEINSDSDLDKIFSDVASTRKAQPYIVSKMDAILDNSFVGNSAAATFNKDINTKSIKVFSDFEYKNENSKFNENLKKELKSVLSKVFITDTKELAILNKKLYDLENIEILPKNNRDLAMLAIAKYEITTLNFDKARLTISKIDSIDKSLKKEYQQIESEANLDINSTENYKKLLSGSDYLDEDEKAKYLTMYLLYHGNVKGVESNFPPNYNYDIEWRFLYGEYLSLLGRYTEAAKQFQKIYDENSLLEMKFLELQALTVDSINKKIVDMQYIVPESLLLEGNRLKKKFDKYKNIEMPALDELIFEMEIISDPEKGIVSIEKQISSESSRFSSEWLSEWKIRTHLILNQCNKAIEYIDSLEEDSITAQIISLKLISLEKNNDYNQQYEYILSLLDSKTQTSLISIGQLIIECFLYASRNVKNVIVDKFEKDIQKIFQKFRPSFFNLIQLEEVRKKIQSPKYGDSFSDIETELQEYYSNDIVKAVCSFLLTINDFSFGQRVYNILISKDKFLADEFYSFLLFNNEKYDELLSVLSKYKNIELSANMVSVKSESLLRIDQLRALILMEKEIDADNPAFWNRVLVAKIRLKDKDRVSSIVEKLLKSSDVESQLNAAYAMVEFGLNITEGVQIYMKYILKSDFKNAEISHNYLSLFFLNIKKLEVESALNKYDNVDLSWYKFSNGKNNIEVVIIPEKWGITFLNGLTIKNTDSDFQLEVRGIKKGEVIFFEGYECILIEEKPLSLYIFHRVLASESGDITSNKAIKTISVDGGIDELVSFMKQTDRTDDLKKIKSLSEKLHAPFFFEKYINKDDIIEFFDSLFEYEEQRYYVGVEQNISDKNCIQISVSSLIFLWNLNLLEILDGFEKVHIESSQQKWLEVMLDKEFNDTTAGKLGFHEGKIFLNEKNEERKDRLKTMYKTITLSSRHLEKNEVGIINEKINKLIDYDGATVQAALENEYTLLVEDEALQTYAMSEFGITAGSVGTLITHYFLYINNDLNGYLDILLSVLEKNNAWKLTKENITSMTNLAVESKDPAILEKLSRWSELYAKYFQ